jgi:hypothetical protein
MHLLVPSLLKHLTTLSSIKFDLPSLGPKRKPWIGFLCFGSKGRDRVVMLPQGVISSCPFPSFLKTPQRVKSAWASTLRRSALHRVKFLAMAKLWLPSEVWMVGVKILTVQSFPDGEVGESHIPETEGTGVRRTATWESGLSLICGVNAKFWWRNAPGITALTSLSESQRKTLTYMPRMNWPWVEP